MNFKFRLMLLNMGMTLRRLVIAALLVIFSFPALSQYFNGPNKPGYKIFEYKVYNTPHFEIYHYFSSDSELNAMALDAEKWYQRHQLIFKDTFNEKNPIILYSDHADFQQTNAIMGNIGIGTGGVTEALKNRVILPIMESAAQTDHVLGHELVHAFQYKLMLGEDSTQMRSIRNIPLWMIEGMAEYLSIGSKDPNTAMWMRDAIINNDFPSLDDLTRSYKYFPYRYGEAFWAFITGIYGDTIIKPLFDLTTKIGYDKALDSLTSYDEKSFSATWKSSTKSFYYQFLKDTIERPVGKKILYAKNSGTVNIAPSLSPDGKYVIFLSEKDLFTFDLYMADAHTGKIIKKVSSTIRNNQIDDFNYLESGGSWSPDGKKFVFVIFSKGKNKLLVIDTKKTKNSEEIDIDGLDALSNPAWSPDGKSIIVTALKNGVTDIYEYNIQGKSVVNLTSDNFCNMIPSWSTDGKQIAFSTDRPSPLEKDTSYGGYRLAILNKETKKTTVLPVFPGADNLNPQFSPDNKYLYFLSDADGFRNLYKYDLDSAKVYRLTNIITGISGITEFTPAFTIDRTYGNIIYTHYFKSQYNLFLATDTSFKPTEMAPDSVNFEAGNLPPFKRVSVNIINPNIEGKNVFPKAPVDSFKNVPYRSKFTLDYIGGTSAGIAVNSYYGTGMAGSVDMLFGDMVGNYQLYSSLAINGQVQDFAGSAAFINNKKKIDWGVALSHIPYKYGLYSYTVDAEHGNAPILNVDIHWIFEDALTLFAVKPITQTQRIEASTSFSYYSFYLERQKYYIGSYTYSFLGRERNLPTDNGFGIATIGTAYTLDNGYMGIASALRGQRFRADLDYYTGSLNFLNVLLDYRKYFFINPFSIATRIYHQGRYGNNSSNNVIRSLYIGWPWLVRGFENIPIEALGDIANLFGSYMAIGNLELRIPFTGPERLCLIPFKYFISELSFFADAGIAWNSDSYFAWDKKLYRSKEIDYKNIAVSNLSNVYSFSYSKYRYPMLNYGVSLRVNFFGYMILEPYYAIPLMKNGSKYGSFGLNFLPGW